MHQFIRVSALLGLLFCCTLAKATPINPITVNLESGPVSVVAGSPGTASYLVSVDAGVRPNATLSMNITTSQPWATVSQATSTCITPTTTCTSPIRLSPGQHCCLMLAIDGTQLAAGGNYTLAPFVATNPAGFGGNAAPQAVTVTAAPTSYTVTIAEGTHGAVAPLGQQTVVANGSTSLLTAAPASGYIVDYWLYTGTNTYSYQGGGLNSTFYDVTEDATIEAFFVPYTASITVPAAPTEVVALNNATTTSASLSWSAPNTDGGTAITNYKVTPYIGAVAQTTTTVGDVLTTPITGLTAGQSYTFTVQAINTSAGSYTAAYGPAGYSSAVIMPTASIVATPSSLALKAGGRARTITFYNNSGAAIEGTALNVPTLPTVENYTTTCLGTISAGSSCTVTIVPGNTATSGCTDGTTLPVAEVVRLTTNIGGPYTANVYVLGYGCRYQGGYIYSINDTTPTTSSIGGSVVTTSDQSTGISWSVDSTSIWGIDEQSLTTLPYPNDAAPMYYLGQLAALITGQVDCNGSTDGSCNTNNIYTYYEQTPIMLNLYATGLCKQPLSNVGVICTAGTANCYNDWYLPSICEMGYFNSSFGINPNSGCGTQASPTLQNIQANLVDNGNVGSIAGGYWSSTEGSAFPQDTAWGQSFSTSGGSFQGLDAKGTQVGVRCSRALTI